MPRLSSRSAVSFILLLLLGCQAPPAEEPATLVVTGARVWTGDPVQPWADAVASRTPAIGGNSAIVAGASGETLPVRICPLVPPLHYCFCSLSGLLASIRSMFACCRSLPTSAVCARRTR